MKNRLTVVLVGLLMLAWLIAAPASETLNYGQENTPPLVSAHPGEVTLTIYQNQNLALIEDDREVELAEGLASYAFQGLSQRLLPDTVQVEVPERSDALQLVEQIYRDEAVSLGRLLERTLGERIEVFAEGGLGTYRGRLVGTQGGIIIEDEAQRLHVIQDASRFTFSTPTRLGGETALLLKLQSELVGSQAVRLSYLSEGLNWSAHYTAVLGQEKSRLDLESWVSITNASGLSYEGATLNLVAGRIHRVQREQDRLAAQEVAKAAAPEAPSFQERAAFEYHLYTLGRPATIPDGETIRQAFLPPLELAPGIEYLYDARRFDGVQVWVTFVNETSVGKPLPAGPVRIYQRGAEGLLFLGEDRIDHTPAGQGVRLFAGLAFDLVAERIQTERDRLGERTFRESYRITLTNRKAGEVTVLVREHLQGDWTISKSSQDFETLDADTIQFQVPVAAGAQAVVTYTVEYSY